MDLRKVALLIVVLGVAVVLLSFKNTSGTSGFGEGLSEEDLTKISPGNIQVTAVFLNPMYPDMSRPAIYVRLDTHSGDLYTYDMLNKTFLEVDGEKYRPIEWKEDDSSWGHHRYGVFTFPEGALELIKKEKKFRLVIELDSTRVLEWRI
ncbi:hypothetical protein [Geoglobus acetivorans]|uniref:hypothetical protein n=1 Tax=Geoglobus acetivorans TaxID=565033 RepID=UPI00064F652A